MERVARESFTQLGLFPPNQPTVLDSPKKSEHLPKSGQEKLRHGVVCSKTARGTYYTYWWNEPRDGKVCTRKKHIRGGAVGTPIGDRRRREVLKLIEDGHEPESILWHLAQLPRSPRRRRYPDWDLVTSE